MLNSASILSDINSLQCIQALAVVTYQQRYIRGDQGHEGELIWLPGHRGRVPTHLPHLYFCVTAVNFDAVWVFAYKARMRAGSSPPLSGSLPRTGALFT